MPTPKPDAAALEAAEIAELREHCQRTLHARYTHPETGRKYEAVLALIAEREELRTSLAALNEELRNRDDALEASGERIVHLLAEREEARRIMQEVLAGWGSGTLMLPSDRKHLESRIRAYLGKQNGR